MEDFKKLKNELLQVFKTEKDDKVFYYKKVIKGSKLPEFWQGYITRYMNEQSKIFDTTEEDYILEIIYFIKNLNIEEK
jgi:hypothetical protein